ncbi:MAG: hypothetical protein RL481_1335 [Pseudomonadota bacterium]|jgi:hypothetical protein
MGAIYLIMMAIPIVLATLVLLVLRRWTRLTSLIRSAAATLTVPSLLIFLYSQSQSTIDADERAAFLVILLIYCIVTAVWVSMLEWRHRSKI